MKYKEERQQSQYQIVIKEKCDMFTINNNYLKLQGSYLFSNIAKKWLTISSKTLMQT